MSDLSGLFPRMPAPSFPCVPLAGYPVLYRELLRVEGVLLSGVGADLTFSDSRLGEIRLDLSGLRAGLFVARREGRSWTRSLRFNPSILERVGEEAFRPTVAHEYAHAVVHVFSLHRTRFPGKDFSSHGALWRSLMELFGHEPKRCHDYPAKPARSVRTFHYLCRDCGKDYRLGPVRHGRLEKNPGYLVCGACRGGIVHSPVAD